MARGELLAQPAREMGEEKLSQAVTETRARFCRSLRQNHAGRFCHKLWQKFGAAMRSCSWMSVNLAKGAA